MQLSYTVLDVFTETPFEGNPLAVVTIPAGETLTLARKQTIAREFNFSETTFVHDVEDRSAVKQRHVDIFTPKSQIPFAGHPTIGTAVFLQPQGVTTLQVTAGTIGIGKTLDGGLKAAIPHNLRLHERRAPEPIPGPAHALDETLIAAERDAPLFSIVNGMTFVLIELPSLEVLGAVRPGGPELPEDLLDAGWRDNWVTRRYYFVRQGTTVKDGREVHQLRARMVKQMMEDPATGSAACALTGYLSLYKQNAPTMTFEITQGVEMGRRSQLSVDVDLFTDSDGNRTVDTIHLGGKAVTVMSGTIHA